jgi:hypothetical protein
MATFYNQVVKNVDDAAEITAVTSDADSTIVLSILAANTNGTDNTDITVVRRDASNNDEGYLAYTIAIPADSNLDVLGNKYVLPSGRKLNLLTSTSGTVDVQISYVVV